MDSLELALVAPRTPQRDLFVASAPPGTLRVLDSVEAFLGSEAEGQGILLMGPGLAPGDLLALLRSQRGRPLPWVTLLVEEEGEVFSIRPLSLGPALGLEAVVEAAHAPAEKGPLPELAWSLRFVSRVRHDLANPLTAGMAELQLLLLQVPEGETREALETLQEQFRRLRVLVGDLSRLKVGR